MLVKEIVNYLNLLGSIKTTTSKFYSLNKNPKQLGYLFPLISVHFQIAFGCLWVVLLIDIALLLRGFFVHEPLGQNTIKAWKMYLGPSWRKKGQQQKENEGFKCEILEI